MKKRILALLVAMSMMTSLAACGAIDDEKYDEFIPLISTDSDSNTDSQTTTDSASGDDSSVPEQTEDPAVTTTANSEEPSSSDTNATDNSSLTNSQSETTTTTTQGENSGSVTTTPASGLSTTTTTTTAKNPTSSATTTTTKKPTSSTTTTTTKKPTSSTTTTTTKKPTSSTTTTTTTRKTTTTTTTTTRKTTTTTTTTAHKHSYTSKITKNATCVAAGEKTYTCSCGHSYTEGISATGHSYTSKVVSATTNAAGYTLHTCSKCSDSYKDAYKFLAPATFTCSGKPITSATLNWSTISGADGYIIEKSTDSGSTWTRAKKVTGGSSSSYTVTSLTPATSYQFRVKAYKIVGEDVYYGANRTLAFYTQLAKVVMKPSYNNTTVVNLEWSKVTGADGYRIERYVNNKWTLVKDVTSGNTTTVMLTNITGNGIVCKFRIRAYSSDGASYSEWTEYSTVKNPTFSVILSRTVSKNSVTFTWAQIDDADGYEIQQYKNGVWTTVKTLSGKATTTCSIGSLASGTTYQFRFRSYLTYNSVNYYSAWSATETITTK